MTDKIVLAAILSPTLLVASCGGGTTGDSAAQSTPTPTGSAPPQSGGEIRSESFGSFDEPWAAAFAPGTPVLFITEKPGTIKFVDTNTRRTGTVSGVPTVDYGGQGGLGEIAFLPAQSSATLDRRTIYLSWAEAGSGGTRGAVVGRGELVCEEADACRIDGMSVIWRQTPKVTGRGHYSHRIAVSPDGRHLYIASGDRQKLTPAQDASNTLGSIVRLDLDGSPAANNPLAGRGSPSDQIWSWGHRNILGMDFDEQGRLWEVEHGPAGGDEFNLVKRGANYGWPTRSNGDHYDGRNIPDHSADDGFAKPAVSWTPVIAPGNFVFYGGSAIPAWRGQAIIAGLKSEALVRVAVDGETAREVGRHDMGGRVRQVVEGPDGALWVLMDGEGGALRKLTAR